jgi:deoxyuridine 5'-triphosphate nucleotidohydrolase
MGETIKICLENILARVPERGSENSAGYDFWGVRIDSERDTTFTIDTGIRMVIPKGKVGILKERSSIGLRGCKLLAGVIDSDFRGVVKIVYPIEFKDMILEMIHHGKAIAQMVIIDHCSLPMEVIDSEEFVKNSTERGEGGFGSTNNKQHGIF